MKITAELQLRRVSYSSNQAGSITLGVHDEDWEQFKGCEGKRFMAVFVEIGNDEQPVDDNHEKIGALCKLAVMWCKDEKFMNWLGVTSEDEAKNKILEKLSIKSRKELDTNKQAGDEFNTVFREPFMNFIKV